MLRKPYSGRIICFRKSGIEFQNTNNNRHIKTKPPGTSVPGGKKPKIN